jgi:hypothetical protein
MTEEDSDFLGLPGLLSPEQTAAILARRDREMRRRAHAAADHDEEPDPQELAGYQQIAQLRRQLSAMVSAYAVASGRPHASVHAELRRRTGGPPTPMATVEQLQARIAALQKL